MKTYNQYEIHLKDKEGHEYISSFAMGKDLDDAIRHCNFWYDDGEKIGTDLEVTSWKQTGTYNHYPFEYEDAMRTAMENKLETVRKILDLSIDELDKLDLIECIVTENTCKYIHLATVCRNYLVNMINRERNVKP